MATNSSLGLPANEVMASASSTVAAPVERAVCTSCCVARADAQRRTEQHRVLASVGEDARQAVRTFERLQHDGGEMGGVDGHGIGRAGDGDQPGADAQRAAGTEARRTGMGCRSRDD